MFSYGVFSSKLGKSAMFDLFDFTDLIEPFNRIHGCARDVQLLIEKLVKCGIEFRENNEK